MTKFEIRMNVQMFKCPNDETKCRRRCIFVSSLDIWSFDIDSNFEFRHSNLTDMTELQSILAAPMFLRFWQPW